MGAVWTLWSFSPLKLGLGGLMWRWGLWGEGELMLPPTPFSKGYRAMPAFSHFPCVFGNRLSLHSWKQVGGQHWCHLQPAQGLCKVLGLGHSRAAPPAWAFKQVEQKVSREKPQCSSRPVPHLSPIPQPFLMSDNFVCIGNSTVGTDGTGLASSCNTSYFPWFPPVPEWNCSMNYKHYIDTVISFIFHFCKGKKQTSKQPHSVCKDS